jgi:hypothetical protein
VDWNVVTAVAAVIVAVGAVGALLATTLQLHQERLAREVDYYRKLTPARMRLASPEHSHPDSWHVTMDWLDLRGHLINVHGVPAEDIDDLEGHVDGTTGRRKHAEDRHRALHHEQPKSVAAGTP